MKYSLRQIEVFLATAHYENITRAADSLAMSQSAASAALKELEQHFDVQLFDRAGKRLQLNELGKALRPQAQELLERAQALEHAFLQQIQVGDLKVGATLTIGNYLAVGVMARFMTLNPGAKVALEVANTEVIARKVAKFELDLGLVEGELQHPALDIQPWRDDELVVFCSPRHPFADGRMLEDKELLQAKWIVRESGSGTRQTFDRAMHGLLPQLQIALELQHTEAIKRAVEADLGIGCLSRVTLVEAFRRGSLVELHLPHRDFRRKFYFILHREKYRSEGIRRWLALCDQSLEAAVGEL